jgi:hypothetical protein
MKKKKKTNTSPRMRWLFIGGLLAGLVLIVGVWWVTMGRAEEPEEAPEAEKVLAVQAGMPFQVLIPAYLPKGFDRANMEIDVSQAGPGGEPQAKLTYRTPKGKTLFIQEWVPVNPDMETLSASRPVETKWGRGWLLRQGESLAALWVDVGPLRASIYTRDVDMLSAEQLLAIAETMGPASNRQVFNFIVEPPEIRAVPPAPPVEATVKDGVQLVDLIITPGGYSPLRFSVKKGMPVRLTFRALGEVGCGNELNLPIDSNQATSLLLESPTDQKVAEFTPLESGQFQFFCGHAMYRGVMVVHD